MVRTKRHISSAQWTQRCPTCLKRGNLRGTATEFARIQMCRGDNSRANHVRLHGHRENHRPLGGAGGVMRHAASSDRFLFGVVWATNSTTMKNWWLYCSFTTWLPRPLGNSFYLP